MLPLPLAAQLSSFSANGYVKYLFSTSKFPFVNERLNDHLIHARLNTRWYPAEPLTAAVEVRMRSYYGDSVEKLPGFLDQIKSHHEYAQLDDVLWHKKKSLGYVQLDRCWINYSQGNAEATLGRQRIAWGTAIVWNVIDLFNPQSILDFDYEEKPGADAVRIQYYTGAVSKVEIAVKPGKTKRRTIAAAHFSINAFEYDFHGIAGIRNDRWIFGGAWAGAIHKAGFRGEFLVSEAPGSSPTMSKYSVFPNALSPFQNNKPVLSTVLSGDYTFSNSLYLLTEILFNSNGKTKNVGLFYWQALQAGMLSPSRWSVFQEISYDITPLLRCGTFAIFNPIDKSSVIVPQLTWSMATNLDLTLIGFFTSGKHFTEWGDFGRSAFLRIKYSF